VAAGALPSRLLDNVSDALSDDFRLALSAITASASEIYR
jgi:hypothetical protein